MSETKLALDRASVRDIDQDGHLHVARTPISKANVCPYLGSEVADGQALGLDPDRTYQLYRDPAELEKAAGSFAGKPLLFGHKPVSADDHDHAMTVGSVTDPEFDNPYLYAALDIWSGPAIRAIESGAQKELSCGYRYRADMTPGEVDGVQYDGVMRDIVGNHVALVSEGRAGPDVVVGDSAIPKIEDVFIMPKAVFSRAADVASGALLVHLRPKLAKDAKIDLSKVFKDVTAKNFKASIPAMDAAITDVLKGKLAKDASVDDIQDVLEALAPILPDDSEQMASVVADDDDDESMDAEGLSPEEEAQYQALMKRRKPAAMDEPIVPKAVATDTDPKDKEMDPKPAMDAAISAAVKAATVAITNAQKAIRNAEREVEADPRVGKLAMAHDSAAGVYRAALKTMGVEAKDVPDSALQTLYRAIPQPQQTRRETPAYAQDAAAAKGFNDRYPDAARIRAL